MMSTRPPADPLGEGGIVEFGARLRCGEITCEAAVAAYLGRIAALNPKLDAFTYVGDTAALTAARGIDALLAAGTDLGPLMGVPVGVKDIYTVDGLPPPTAGSRIDVSDLVAPEGSFIKAIKRAGCVILGKTRTTEFAASMFNLTHPMPWNPWDPVVHRMPGGSSSGSAVAMAAGLCAFSLGTDTGGSVREPAALCGVFGYKSSVGLWACDGVFPLSPTIDSLGFFTARARDAAIVFDALGERTAILPRAVQGLRLGRPVDHFLHDLDPTVAEYFSTALAALTDAGAEVVPIEIPEVREVPGIFERIIPPELLATLGRDRFLAKREMIDPAPRVRCDDALEMAASEYIRAVRRHHTLSRMMDDRILGLDGWVTPTTPDRPTPVGACATPEAAIAWSNRSGRNTRPGNLFGQCGVSMPIQRFGADLPVGLQLLGSSRSDAALLSIAMGVEDVLGAPPKPDVSRFS